ncbi:MAG: glycosyltransferase family 4 protein, partial [Candidatus Hodarchaeota archaeon]
MKINFILDMEKSLAGSGVFSSATRLAVGLRKKGFTVDINGKNPPYDIYHFHTALPQSMLKARLWFKKLRHGKHGKIVMHGHTTIEDFRDSFLFSNHIDWILIPYLKRYYALADHLIAVSPYNRAVLLRYGYPPDKISVISNGIDLSRFSGTIPTVRTVIRNFFGLKSQQLICLSLGICIWRKAPDIVVDVAQLTPDHHFFWLGKYFPLSSLAHAARLRQKFQHARTLPNLQFTDYVSYKTLVGMFHAADVFLYPSREENQGIALLEAMAYGKIPVVRDHPVFDWLTHGHDCLKATTPKEFSEALYKVAANHSLREMLQHNGQETLKIHRIETAIDKI